MSQPQAAERMGVSRRLVQDAVVVLQQGVWELQEAVDSGISVARENRAGTPSDPIDVRPIEDLRQAEREVEDGPDDDGGD